jgi:hypothetical protein
MLTGILLIVAAVGSAPTDFGLRTVGAMPARADSAALPIPEPAVQPRARGAFRISAAATVGARFGRVTSTVRSPEHNRRVGGARNSWHIHGRAVDIARHPGVTHAQIANELRRAGFQLIESLDEGDHSHFAFGVGPVRLPPRSRSEQLAEIRGEANYFRFVTVPAPTRMAARAR